MSEHLLTARGVAELFGLSPETVLSRPITVYLTKREAAARARVSERTIERAMAADEIRYFGGGPNRLAVRIRPGDVDRWLEQRGRQERR